MQLLAPLALTLSTLAFNAYASPDARNVLEIRYPYFRPHQIRGEITLGGLLGLVRRQTCSSDEAACVDSPGFCCPIRSSCCTGAGAGGCCFDTEYCSTVDGIPGCCANGHTCSQTSDSSPSSTYSIQTYFPVGISSTSDTSTSTSTANVSLSITDSSSSTSLGGSTSISTSSVSSLSSPVNSPVLSSSNNAGSTRTGSASPSGQTTGGGNPFNSSGTSPSTTGTSLGFTTLCGSAFVSLLAAALI